MPEVKEKQTCPYCGHEEDDCLASWDEEPEEVNCSHCQEPYYANAEYKFLGFKVQKICRVCECAEEDCFCEEGDTP